MQNFKMNLEITVSPLVNMRDFTRSQMFSRTRSSMCWNNGTWNTIKEFITFAL